MQILVIVLVVVIGAIWLLVKIGEGIAAAISAMEKDYVEAAARRKQSRYARRRDALTGFVRALVPNELDLYERRYETAREGFERLRNTTNWKAVPPAWKKIEFYATGVPQKEEGYCEMHIEDVDAILKPNSNINTWTMKESEIIARQCRYPSIVPAARADKYRDFPILSAELKAAAFEVNASRINQKDTDRYFAEERNSVKSYNERRSNLLRRVAELNSAVEEWNRENRIAWESYVVESKRLEANTLFDFETASELYTRTCKEEVAYFERLRDGYSKGQKPFVIERLGFVLNEIKLPGSVPHTWDIDFDEAQGIAVIDIGLPDVVHRPPYKTVVLKSGVVKKPLNQSERKEQIPKVHPAVLLRTAYEVFRNDLGETIKLLVVNGWIKFDDPATGKNTKAYTASLMVRKDQIASLNLSKIDPIAAFNNLHGKSAGKLVEIIPIEPVLSLNRTDSRFVDAKEVLSGLGAETNLAAINWQDFEHLIRELFEKEFHGRGAEVKITQASRDRGVDAIVFVPDPIHGGKYVIQAKRYTNTVDVSAVRDLCAVVKKEGASRGILVTTSTYGADAYAFANNEPVTLLNGAELLGLLKKHGYSFRINLHEARRMNFD